MPGGAFHHHGRTVSDMERALGFYRDLLDLDVFDDAMVGGAEMTEFLGLPIEEEFRAVMLSESGGAPFMELFEFKGAPEVERHRQSPRTAGATHPCFLVADIVETYERLSAAGVEFTRPPLEIDDGPFKGQWILYGFDPDGAIVEFWSVVER